MSALLLWKDLHVRKKEYQENGNTGTQNIRFELCAEGVTAGKFWKVGFEFDYANTELLYCRLLEEKTSQPFPEGALTERMGFLPPMTGGQIIVATHSETVLDEAAQTGQVIAFVGKPHDLIKNAELKKALNLIGYTDYVQAERFGRIMYMEGSTDLRRQCVLLSRRL